MLLPAPFAPRQVILSMNDWPQTSLPPKQDAPTHLRQPSPEVPHPLPENTVYRMEISYIIDQSRELDFRKGIPWSFIHRCEIYFSVCLLLASRDQ